MERPFDINAYASAWNSHSVDRILSFYAEDAEVVALPNPEPYRGREGIRKSVTDVIKGLPDINGDVAWSVQQGNKVATLIHLTGRHTGPLELAPGQVIEPTGKDVRFELGVFLELEANGKIKRETQVPDSASLLMQIGVLGGEQQAAGARGARQTGRAR